MFSFGKIFACAMMVALASIANAAVRIPDGVPFGAAPVPLAELRRLEGHWNMDGDPFDLVATGDGAMASREGPLRMPVFVTRRGGLIFMSFSLSDVFSDEAHALLSEKVPSIKAPCYTAMAIDKVEPDALHGFRIDIDRTNAANRQLSRTPAAAAHAQCWFAFLFGLNTLDQQRVVMVRDPDERSAFTLRRIAPPPR